VFGRQTDVRTLRVWFVAGAVLVVVGGCDGGRPRVAAPPSETTAASGPDRAANQPSHCSGSETDLSREPPYSANYLYRFRNAQGCQVRLDVMMYRKPGPDHHCAPWPPEIVLVNPVGVPFGPTSTTLEPTYIGARIYVRDPDGTWRDPSLPMGFDPNVTLPSDARDTGYFSDAGRLFVVAKEDRFVYVVTETVTERWPREKLTGCA
jgi:hypothetical protein